MNKAKKSDWLLSTHLGGGWWHVLIRFSPVALVAIVGATKVNFHDTVWATAFLVGSAITLVGVGILSWERSTISNSVVGRYCGYVLLILGIIALLVISFFDQWFKSV